ncbi:hypothetical protein [Caudoviricetes sp.]|nr:hypothetical protein [Caudoviricetes sp.]
MRTKSITERRYAMLICTPETVQETRKRYVATRGASVEPLMLMLTVNDDGKLELLTGAA